MGRFLVIVQHMTDHCQGETHDTTSATSVSLSWFFVLLDIDPGIDNSRLPVDGGEMQQEDLDNKLRVGEQPIRLASREFLPSIHRQEVYIRLRKPRCLQRPSS